MTNITRFDSVFPNSWQIGYSIWKICLHVLVNTPVYSATQQYFGLYFDISVSQWVNQKENSNWLLFLQCWIRKKCHFNFFLFCSKSSHRKYGINNSKIAKITFLSLISNDKYIWKSCRNRNHFKWSMCWENLFFSCSNRFLFQ